MKAHVTQEYWAFRMSTPMRGGIILCLGLCFASVWGCSNSSVMDTKQLPITKEYSHNLALTYWQIDDLLGSKDEMDADALETFLLTNGLELFLLGVNDAERVDWGLSKGPGKSKDFLVIAHVAMVRRVNGALLDLVGQYEDHKTPYPVHAILAGLTKANILIAQHCRSILDLATATGEIHKLRDVVQGSHISSEQARQLLAKMHAALHSQWRTIALRALEGEFEMLDMYMSASNVSSEDQEIVRAWYDDILGEYSKASGIDWARIEALDLKTGAHVSPAARRFMPHHSHPIQYWHHTVSQLQNMEPEKWERPPPGRLEIIRGEAPAGF